MASLQFQNINEAQVRIIDLVLREGNYVITRDLKTKEIAPIYFSIFNPLQRITNLKFRKWNFPAALGELVWHLSGSNDTDFISTYLPAWKQFSSDGKHIEGSCYGHLIFKKNESGQSKWNEIVSLLKSDLYSRRAVINLLNPFGEINSSNIDISCTSSLQFLIRNGAVDLIVNMRSNDLIWGLPYDFFFFSFLQEMMSLELNMSIGKYFHLAGSMHIYERHFELAKKIVEKNNFIDEFGMPNIENINELSEFIEAEKHIRLKNLTFEEIQNLNISQYWKQLLKVLYYYNCLKRSTKVDYLDEIKIKSIYRNFLK